MNTTSIVVEHLVIGAQAFVWVILFICSMFGFEWMEKAWMTSEVVAIVGSLVFVYPVGIFVDEIADMCFKPLTTWIRRKHKLPDKQTVFQLLVLLENESTTQYFQYLRSRIRIARSSTINFFVITIASCVVTVTQLSHRLDADACWFVLFEVVVGLGLTAIAFIGAYRMNDTFAKRLRWGYDIEQRRSKLEERASLKHR